MLCNIWKMEVYVVYFILFLQLKESTSFSLNLTNPIFTTTCVNGLKDSEDMYSLTGTLDASVGILNQRSKLYVEIMTSVSSPSYETLCILTFNSTCDMSHMFGPCVCESYVNSVLQLVLNKTAQIKDSQGSIRLRWPPYGIGSTDYSPDSILPPIYPKPEEKFTIGGKDVTLQTNVSVPISAAFLSWCVHNLQNITLEFYFNDIHREDKECINYTFPSNLSSINLTVSYRENEGCKRSKAYQLLVLFTETTSSNNTGFSDASIGVLIGHIACTVIVVVITVTTVILTLKSENEANHLKLIMCTLLMVFEIASFVLVIIAGTKINSSTTLDLWKIMLIYQCIAYIILIILESILLGIYTDCACQKSLSQPWIFLIILICIHSVIGWIVLPFLSIVCNKKASVNMSDTADSHDLKDKRQSTSDIEKKGSHNIKKNHLPPIENKSIHNTNTPDSEIEMKQNFQGNKEFDSDKNSFKQKPHKRKKQ